MARQRRSGPHVRNVRENRGQTDHTVGVTQFDGAIFNDDGRAFLDKAVGLTRYAGVA